MKRLVTSVLFLTCLVAAPLSAQTDQTGVLEGTVQDAAGGAIALADVRIGPSNLAERQGMEWSGVSPASGVRRAFRPPATPACGEQRRPHSGFVDSIDAKVGRRQEADIG